MKKIKFFIICVCWVIADIYLINGFVSQFKDVQLRVADISLEVMREIRPDLIAVLDIDGDQNDELVCSQPFTAPSDAEISIFDPIRKAFNLGYFGEIRIPKRSVYYHAYYDKVTTGCIFQFMELRDGQFYLTEINNKQSTIKEMRITGLQDNLPKPNGFTPKYVDLNNDDYPELLVRITAAYEGIPRGIMCVDPIKGKVIWQKYSGTAIHQIDTVDIDKDGIKEIVCASCAPQNGADYGGTSDSYSYVIVYDHKGEELWKQKIGEWYSKAWAVVVDLDQDSRYEMITTMNSHQARNKFRGRMEVFDALTGKRKLSQVIQHSSYSFSQPIEVTIPGEGPRVYFGDANGWIWQVGRDYKAIKIHKEEEPIRFIENYSGKDLTKYLFAVTPRTLLAYNKKMTKKVLSYPFAKILELEPVGFPMSCILLPLQRQDKDCSVLVADRMYLLEEKSSSFKNVLKNYLKSGLPFTLLLILMLNGGAFYLYKVKKKNQVQDSHSEDKSQFLIMMQELAHQIKNPLSTILFTAERIKGSLKHIKTKKEREQFSQLSDFLIDDVTTLKEHTNNIMKLISILKPRIERIDIVPYLHSIFEKFQATLPTRINMEWDLQDQVFMEVDKELFKGALLNFLDNSVEAIKDHGKISVQVMLVTSAISGKQKELFIEIEDSGEGITKEDVGKIFDSHYSTKTNNLGVGLTIAKRVIEAHGGKIKVHSKKGVGTRIAINIPIQPMEAKGE